MIPDLVEAFAHYDAARWNQAGEALERALSSDPLNAEAWYRLGNVRQEQDRLSDAAQCFERVVALDPGHARAWNNLGASLEQQGKDGPAARAYRRALAQEPALAQAIVNLAQLCRRIGSADEARELFTRAAGLARPYLSAAEAALQESDQAKAERNLAAALELLPGDPTLLHMLAAARGEASAAPPAGYVDRLFNDFADGYDRHMVEDLQYRVPALLAEAVGPFLRGTSVARVVDLGCGTGLVATALGPGTRDLIGIDLSKAMLDRAAQRRSYSRLIQGDVVDELSRLPAGSIDVILAADVLVYMGSLDPLFAAVSRALRRGGVFAFSVEALSGSDYRLGPMGRYAHSAGYLRRLASARGMEELRMDSIHPRRDHAQWIDGWLACFRMKSS